MVGYGARFASVPAGRSLSTVLTGKQPCPVPRETVPPANPLNRDEEEEGGTLAEEDFGSLSAGLVSRRSFRKTSPVLRDMSYQEDEDEPVPYRSQTGRKNTPYWYFLQCKKLIKENKLEEALSLFEGDMLRGERLQPEEFNYTLLIGGCGRAGRLKDAFKLYNNMKKRGLVATDATYTALFNACAESPWKQTGLQQALLLEQELRQKNHQLNAITYHALLKTHALANHLRACLHTLKEMLQNGHAVTSETFHFLLMGCVRDKETGFRLALQVWRQMLRMGLRPVPQNYNLLLRAARDCGIGDPALASALLLAPEGRRGEGGGATLDVDFLERRLFLEAGPGRCDDSASHRSDALVGGRGGDEAWGGQNSALFLMEQGERESFIGPLACQSGEIAAAPPNLLDLWVGHRGVVSLGTVSGASDRLALVGGAEGFLEKMAADGVRPDVKTLSLLADTMEPSRQSLQTLLQVAKQHRVKLDTAFFNSVIRRMAREGDLEGAKAVVSVMAQRHVSVNMQTYGSLALGCGRQEDGLQLLTDIEEAGLKPSVHVFSALIGRAGRRLDFVYLKEVLKSMRRLGIPPNHVIIRQLEFAAQYPAKYDKYKSRNNYLNQIDGFRGYYQQWLSCMPAQEDTPPGERGPEGEQADEGRAPERDQLSVSQKNQQAAARRYKTARRDKQPG